MFRVFISREWLAAFLCEDKRIICVVFAHLPPLPIVQIGVGLAQ